MFRSITTCLLILLTGMIRADAPVTDPAATTASLEAVAMQPETAPGMPAGLQRVTYRSSVDQREDWALLLPPAAGQKTWVVSIHGFGAHGDQLYTRSDMPPWVEAMTSRGLGILTPNLRDNAWMSPAAATDLHALLQHVRERYGATHFVFVSGSMGGTSNLIYGVLHPEDVAGIVALCPATDLASYAAWCAEQTHPVARQIGEVIGCLYGSGDSASAARYARHSAQRNAQRLTMPVYVIHGTDDVLIPVSQGRALAGQMQQAPHFVYRELPGGDHDSPLAYAPEALAWVLRQVDASAAQ